MRPGVTNEAGRVDHPGGGGVDFVSNAGDKPSFRAISAIPVDARARIEQASAPDEKVIISHLYTPRR